MNGIEKEVDNLGRVVIPMEFRKRLGIVSNSKVMVSLEGDIIVFSPLREILRSLWAYNR